MKKSIVKSKKYVPSVTNFFIRLFMVMEFRIGKIIMALLNSYRPFIFLLQLIAFNMLILPYFVADPEVSFNTLTWSFSEGLGPYTIALNLDGGKTNTCILSTDGHETTSLCHKSFIPFENSPCLPEHLIKRVAKQMKLKKLGRKDLKQLYFML